MEIKRFPQAQYNLMCVIIIMPSVKPFFSLTTLVTIPERPGGWYVVKVNVNDITRIKITVSFRLLCWLGYIGIGICLWHVGSWGSVITPWTLWRPQSCYFSYIWLKTIFQYIWKIFPTEQHQSVIIGPLLFRMDVCEYTQVYVLVRRSLTSSQFDILCDISFPPQSYNDLFQSHFSCYKVVRQVFAVWFSNEYLHKLILQHWTGNTWKFSDSFLDAQFDNIYKYASNPWHQVTWPFTVSKSHQTFCLKLLKLHQ